jgi:preprotein translocase subunit YajC
MTLDSFLIAMGVPQQGGNPWAQLLLPLIIVGIFYLIVVLPMRRNQQKVQQFLSALKVGDRVVTSGGIYGSITRVGDDAVQLQIAEKVRIDVARSAIVGYQGQPPVAPSEGQSK